MGHASCVPSRRYDNPLAFVLFDNMENRWAVKSPIEQLVMRKCNTRCQEWIKHMVSFHLRGRSHTSFLRAAAVMYALTESHQAAIDYIDMTETLREERGLPPHGEL